MTKHIVKYPHLQEWELTYSVVLAYMPKLLDLRAIRFKWHHRIKHHLIGFQNMNLGTMQGDKHFCGRHSVKLAQLKACSQSKQGAYSRSHAYPTSQHVQNARGFRSTSRSTLILFTHTASHSKSKGLKINVPFYSYTLYTCNAAYKNKGLLIDVPFYAYTFYMCSATYKKQSAPNQNIIILFIHIHHWRMKSRGHLYIYIA
jgi:hypothetical protein